MDNFLLEQKIMDEAISSLESLIRSNPDARELKRAIAVKMKLKGYSNQFILELLGVSCFFARSWKAFLEIVCTEMLATKIRQ